MSDNLEPVLWENYEIGQSASFTKTITEEDVMKFAEVTGDYNPIHVNPEYAKTQMFGKQVAHGALSSGLISAVLGTKLFGPGILYGGQTVKDKFTKKEGKLKFIIADTIVKNQNDEIVTSGEGTIVFM
ncbi:MAG: MaoC family dehydratase [Promethearchaeota archaeon]|jgi:acyl dehydratase